MSNTDSFIDEVSEEVRRDRLFLLLRRYGWIAVVVVVAIVGGAAWNEWQKSRVLATAQARGDALISALEHDESADRASALNAISDTGETAVVVGFMTATEALASGDVNGALAALRAIEQDATLPALYHDLATLKRVMLESETTDASARRADLEAIAAPGAPFRLLAQEQIALIEIADGDTDAALSRLRAIREDTEITSGLQLRISDLILALGGDTAEG